MVAKGIQTRAPLIASPAFYLWATVLHNHVTSQHSVQLSKNDEL